VSLNRYSPTSIRFIRNILIPGWIMSFGLVALSAPPLGMAASVSWFLVGVFVIPALALIPSARVVRADVTA
jgi:hypothetical protein